MKRIELYLANDCSDIVTVGNSDEDDVYVEIG